MPEETLKRMMLLENRIAEQDLLLAQWESIDELNRERSQQRLQRIAQLEAESNRRLELLREMEEFVWDDEQSAYFCQICGANSNHGHLDDCRLAKELGDE